MNSEKRNFEKEDLYNLDTELKKLGERKMSNDGDLFSYFSDVNTIIKEAGLYVNVKDSVKEIKNLISSYREIDEKGEFTTDIVLYLNENEPIQKFEMTFTLDGGEEVTRQGDIVLQCEVTYSINEFSITPSIFFVFYEEDDSDDILFEEDEEEKSLSIKSLAGIDNQEEDAFELDSEEEEYDPELADDEIIKDLLRNVVVSKIYEEGYEYPNEETIDELTEKMFDSINDIMDQYLTKGNENEPEEDEEEEEEDEIGQTEDEMIPSISDYTSIQKTKKGDYLEIHEEKSGVHLWLFDIRLPLGMVVSYVVDGKTETDAKKNLTKEVLQRHGTENYEVLNVLPIKDDYFKFN
ncbi:MAG: hypothetical protein N3A54_01435 [Patescibacteria group bacterium]|nr:hypothetical protein [Patescibacteria group bacterium]